jgi:hypothetical protein
MADHRLLFQGTPGNLDRAEWSCACGAWQQSGTPKVGPWGRTTNKARIAQVEMAHGKHVRAALRGENI